MKARDYYNQLLSTLPPGGEETLMRVMAGHVGADRAITRPALLAACREAGAGFSEDRQMRLTIMRLRANGVPICSSSGDFGYFLPETLDEYREFRGREFVKKIQSMRDVVIAMDEQARQMFAGEYSEYLRQKSEQAGQPALL